MKFLQGAWYASFHRSKRGELPHGLWDSSAPPGRQIFLSNGPVGFSFGIQSAFVWLLSWSFQENHWKSASPLVLVLNLAMNSSHCRPPDFNRLNLDWNFQWTAFWPCKGGNASGRSSASANASPAPSGIASNSSWASRSRPPKPSNLRQIMGNQIHLFLILHNMFLSSFIGWSLIGYSRLQFPNLVLENRYHPESFPRPGQEPTNGRNDCRETLAFQVGATGI